MRRIRDLLIAVTGPALMVVLSMSACQGESPTAPGRITAVHPSASSSTADSTAADESVGVAGEQEEDGEVESAAEAAKAPKVGLCHRARGGSYSLIMVATTATGPHLAHGDGLPGTDAFDSDCQPIEDNCSAVPNPGQQDGDFDGVGDACDNCVGTANSDQAICSLDAPDASGDACDTDDDGDTRLDDDDTADCDPAVCGDGDGDTCDDCSSGSFDQQSDGAECAAELGGSDGACDAGDSDDDNDGAADNDDPADCDRNLCGDSDVDTCDDCSSGSFDPSTDGTECAAELGGPDGFCDAGDPDDDDDGVADDEDTADCDPTVCGDSDRDTCDDCSSGSFDTSMDGTECATELGGRDGVCDAGDTDDDNDGLDDDIDTDDCDPD